jgi:predicted Zn-dependent protease
MTPQQRRDRLEAMLRDDPNDDFLRYGLAMEFVSVGELETAVQHLRDLIANKPDRPYVPAFLMAAQSLVKLGRATEAMSTLRQGIDAAGKQNELHAQGEMQGLLESLE